MQRTNIDKSAIAEVYQNVRSDSSKENWFVLSYNDSNEITVTATGEEYAEFKSKLTSEDRTYGYVRFITGDEMSKRAKFAFITWIGPSCKALQKAAVSTDKAVVKEVVQVFAVEILATDASEISENRVREEVMKAGGANYGTGQ